MHAELHSNASIRPNVHKKMNTEMILVVCINAFEMAVGVLLFCRCRTLLQACLFCETEKFSFKDSVAYTKKSSGFVIVSGYEVVATDMNIILVSMLFTIIDNTIPL